MWMLEIDEFWVRQPIRQRNIALNIQSEFKYFRMFGSIFQLYLIINNNKAFYFFRKKKQ